MIDPITNSQATESSQEYTYSKNKTLDYPINKYEVKVILDRDNKFIGIKEIRINKDFLSYQKKSSQNGYHDVAEFYKH